MIIDISAHRVAHKSSTFEGRVERRENGKFVWRARAQRAQRLDEFCRIMWEDDIILGHPFLPGEDGWLVSGLWDDEQSARNALRGVEHDYIRFLAGENPNMNRKN